MTDLRPYLNAPPITDVTVTLTWPELQLSYLVAGQQYAFARQNKLISKHGAVTDSLEMLGGEVLGTRGEMAVAKALNLYWSGNVGNPQGIDVGGLVQVRTVPASHYRLILYPTDRHYEPFVLVDGSACPDMRLVGWMYAGEGQKPEFWDDPAGKGRGGFFVPTELLRPMSELRL